MKGDHYLGLKAIRIELKSYRYLRLKGDRYYFSISYQLIKLRI